MVSQLKQFTTAIAAFSGMLLGALLVLGIGAKERLWDVSPFTLVLAVTLAVLGWFFTPRQWLWHRYTRRFAAIVGAVALILVVRRANEVSRVRRAVSSVLTQGGRVSYDYQWDDGNFFKTRTGWILPSLVRNIVGDEWFAEVDYVYLGMGYATDENIREFDLMPFRTVTFVSSPITDKSLAAMKLNPKLRYLGLSHTKITDTGISHLRSLHELEDLVLTGTSVTDHSIEHLTSLKNLKMLLVKDTKITSVGLRRLRTGLPGCGVVNN